MLERWTLAVIRKRALVLGTWLILAALGILASANLTGLLTTSISVPGSQSAKADQILAGAFNENVEGTFTVILNFKKASQAQLDGINAKIASATSQIPTAKVQQHKAIGGTLVTTISTSFTLIDAASYTPKLRKALIDRGLADALVTGPPAINFDVTPVLADDLHKGQLIALSLALLLLLIVLGLSWAVFIPFIFAGATIAVTLGIIYVIAQKFLMVLYIPNVIELIGLGLAIDYSLLIVHRFRREILGSGGADNGSVERTIIRTMESAGRTVALSGIVVAIGLSTLLLLPIPFLRSLGIAGLLVPVISISAALTLQPALLSFFGAKAVMPLRLKNLQFKGLLSKGELMDGFWAKTSRHVIRRPKIILLATVVLLGALASATLWLEVTPSSLTALPKGIESAQALTYATDRAGLGVITPNEIVIDLGSAAMAQDPGVMSARNALAEKISSDPEVFLVAKGESAPYVESSGRYLRIFVIGRHEVGAPQSQALVKELRNIYIPGSIFPQGTKIYLGGAPAQGVDLLDSLAKSLPWIIFLALALAFILLVRAFGSIVLPLKAIAMNLISVAVAFGSIVLVFKFHVGQSFLHTYHLEQLEAWALIFIFVLIFGLSMDYEIFVVSRMKEARENGASNSDAIVIGMANTGGVVSAAAVILVAALGGLVFGHFAGLQEIGVGLACGVLIDATIIRGLLVPSAMALFGRWNWWLPPRIAHLAKVKASLLEVREARL